VQAQAAFFTLPARMQAVHTRSCFREPATTARTRFKFGFHRRRRVLFAWLTTLPNCGPLPQSSHFIAIVVSCFQKSRKAKLFIVTNPRPSSKLNLN
jgi:hypothetical protein